MGVISEFVVSVGLLLGDSQDGTRILISESATIYKSVWLLVKQMCLLLFCFSFLCSIHKDKWYNKMHIIRN